MTRRPGTSPTRAGRAGPGLPGARYVPVDGKGALGALPLLALVVGWGAWHLLQLTVWRDSTGPGLGYVWLASFLLLWWLPVCWLERPATVTDSEQQGIDGLRVTVQVPVYNEDAQVLRACLESVFAQSRRVQRVCVVDDGSVDGVTGEPLLYDAERAWFLDQAGRLGIEATWDRTPNRGKRWAQMHVLAEDDADVFATLDSDSVLDEHAVAEGLKPFADPRVQSVAGLVVPLNVRTNVLTRLTTVLYVPFTRGLRSAQSVLGSVLINSGTLAFYRADVVRKHAGVYEREAFRGVPMQMNDDSMLTMYARLEGRTVHQPSAVCFTLVPDRAHHYFRQQLRWMRGTTVRHLWWLRHMPLRSLAFWMPVVEYAHLVLALLLPVVVLVTPELRGQWGPLAQYTLILGCALNYLVSLRLFAIRRTDETLSHQVLMFALSPVAGLWRLMVLRPLYLYAMATCWQIGSWGTRARVEVGVSPAR
ncbi:hypothetical protein GCM10022384_36640 [Streptomyces marokkonensis]|uniref:Hyaluronan synthase n=1 Tax=Streptomyces marokkonensis TaxID=324855 RepID=A0ABP7QMZ8_9ACTN